MPARLPFCTICVLFSQRCCDVSITGCRVDVLVAQRFLNPQHFYAQFHELSCVGMTSRLHSSILLDPMLQMSCFETGLRAAGVHGFAGQTSVDRASMRTGKKQTWVSVRGPEQSQHLVGHLRQGNMPINATFANADQYTLFLGMHIRDLHDQAFADLQAETIDKQNENTETQFANCIDDEPHFPASRDVWSSVSVRKVASSLGKTCLRGDGINRS